MKIKLGSKWTFPSYHGDLGVGIVTKIEGEYATISWERNHGVKEPFEVSYFLSSFVYSFRPYTKKTILVLENKC